MTRYRILHIPTLRKYWKEFESNVDLDNILGNYDNIMYDNSSKEYFSLGHSGVVSFRWDVRITLKKEEFM